MVVVWDCGWGDVVVSLGALLYNGLFCGYGGPAGTVRTYEFGTPDMPEPLYTSFGHVALASLITDPAYLTCCRLSRPSMK